MTVFVLTDSQKLVAMAPAQFAAEVDFQQLLETFPELLSGGDDGTGPLRRWLLIKREKSIPAEDGGAARWSVDHLFVDQEGVPTFVEVKRQTDTRLRREVVGQMLDYAANAVVHWPTEHLRLEFEGDCAARGIDPDEQIRERLGLEGGAESLWQLVKTNLLAGRIRLLFVADRIPSELRRIVEFLNKQMDPAEVLALELRQFAGEGLKTIVPVIYGQTEESQQKKNTYGSREWDEDSIIDEIGKRRPAIVATARQIAEWINRNADQVWFGAGLKDASMAMMIRSNGQGYYPVYLWTYGRVQITFQQYKRPLFVDTVKQQELLRR